jgi:fructose 5-dehydrogenase small subunit
MTKARWHGTGRPARRDVILGLGMAGTAIAFSSVAPAQGAGENESTLTRFLDLSRLATRRRSLDAVLGRRIYEELNRTTQRFDFRVDALRHLADRSGIDDVEVLTATLEREDRDLAQLLHAIIVAWYTGVVGDGPDAKLVAYANALMFDTVRDAVAVPSYCLASPTGWSGRPPAV